LLAIKFLGLDATECAVSRQHARITEPRIGLLSVVNDADDDRSVDVVFDKIDQHFLANSGKVLAAPGRAGAGVDDANPTGGSVVEIRAELGMFLGPLPVKLHFDAAHFVGVDLGFVARSDDEGTLDARGSGSSVTGMSVGRSKRQTSSSSFEPNPVRGRNGFYV